MKSGFTGDSRLNEGPYKLTRIETISTGSVNINKIGYSNVEPPKESLLNTGDILFSNINSLKHIGKTAIYQVDDHLYYGMNLLRFIPENNSFPLFIYYLLNTYSKRKWVKEHANQAVNQASINQTELGNWIVDVPTKDEEYKIGSLLQDIDANITLHQRLKIENDLT